MSVESQRTGVLVVASGAPWESAALRELTARPTIVVLKRCMDVTDLMATAAEEQEGSLPSADGEILLDLLALVAAERRVRQHNVIAILFLDVR